MSGKTVEEVAREIANEYGPMGRAGDILRAKIETALRQREQETALECARIVYAERNQWRGQAIKAALGDASALIRSRFPKDQG